MSRYSIGDPIEYVDSIDHELVYPGTIVFLESFAGQLLIYIAFDDEKKNQYSDPRFTQLYGAIIHGTDEEL